VIAFQDIETFPISVISDFILRNRGLLSRLPFVLLFGVASTIQQFQQMLSTTVIQSLSTQIFQVRLNDDCLKLIVDEVRVIEW